MGIDALFDAMILPSRSTAASRKRIDGAVSTALGPLANRLEGRHEVSAFHGARERVLRAAKSDTGTVIVEGVNLAGRDARMEADALVSKCLRIRAGSSDQTRFVIGYLASPGGLNGETHMRDWMVEQVSPDVYDLNAEQERFRSRTLSLLDASGNTLRIL